jgi:UDP-glucuronate 4-epimerase
MKKLLVTGAAGFIGSHATRDLVASGYEVVALDNMSSGPSFNLKEARLARLRELRELRFVRADITDGQALLRLFERERFDGVLNLAARPGVRDSLLEPALCIEANLVGFGHILEACRLTEVKHLVYASSSSVYGLNERLPWSTHAGTNHPASLYAATKKANELMAHSYSHVYRLPTTGLRFFTVYGPFGRPDMAPMLFATAIAEGRPIQLFNNGKAHRDFTYIGDVVRAIRLTISNPPAYDQNWNAHRADPASSSAPYQIFNVGKGHPESLFMFLEYLERYLGKRAERVMLPMQPGDVLATYAELDEDFPTGPYRPEVSLEEGVEKFAAWFNEYYQLAPTEPLRRA